jgi:hypothetical protein
VNNFIETKDPAMKLLLVALAIALLLTSCNRYYMPLNVTAPASETVKKFISENRHFILRDSTFVYEIHEMVYDDSTQTISGQLRRISKLRTVHVSSPSKKNYYYVPTRHDSLVRNEVHLFTSETLTNVFDAPVSISVSKIHKIEELKFNRKKTTNNHILVGLGVTAGIATVVALVASISVISSLSMWGAH